MEKKKEKRYNSREPLKSVKEKMLFFVMDEKKKKNPIMCDEVECKCRFLEEKKKNHNLKPR